MENRSIKFTACLTLLLLIAHLSGCTIFYSAPEITSSATTEEICIGVEHSFQLEAESSFPDETTYESTELPPGLSLNNTTGLISGTPTQLGETEVTLFARDGISAGFQDKIWNVTVCDPELGADNGGWIGIPDVEGVGVND